MAVKALFSADDIDGIQRLTGKKYELVRGELYEMTTAPRANVVTMRLAYLVMRWNETTKAGTVGGDIGFTLERRPDTVRAPDVCFIRAGRLPLEKSRRGYPEMSPDFVAEVRSPNDRWTALRAKAAQFIEHGTRLVWIVEPDKFVEVHRPEAASQRFGFEDVLTGEDVMPGFSCRVSELFPEQY